MSYMSKLDYQTEGGIIRNALEGKGRENIPESIQKGSEEEEE